MTDSGTLELTELDQLLDFDPLCSVRRIGREVPPCEFTARWAYICPGCRVMTFCDGHHDEIAAGQFVYRTYRCGACQRYFPDPVPWVKL